MFSKLVKKVHNRKGFTLIELIVVIAIIGVLAAIIVPSIAGFVGKAKKQASDAAARTAYSVASTEIQLGLSNGTVASTDVSAGSTMTITGNDRGKTNPVLKERIADGMGSQLQVADTITIKFAGTPAPDGTIDQIDATIKGTKGSYKA